MKILCSILRILKIYAKIPTDKHTSSMMVFYLYITMDLELTPATVNNTYFVNKLMINCTIIITEHSRTSISEPQILDTQQQLRKSCSRFAFYYYSLRISVHCTGSLVYLLAICIGPSTAVTSLTITNGMCNRLCKFFLSSPTISLCHNSRHTIYYVIVS